MFSKFFWSLAVTFSALTASFIDGVEDYYILADQSINLFFSGFGAIIVGLVVSDKALSGDVIVEVGARQLLLSFFTLFFLFLIILLLGKFRDADEPSMLLSISRTIVGVLALGVGLTLAEGFMLREKKQTCST